MVVPVAMRMLKSVQYEATRILSGRCSRCGATLDQGDSYVSVAAVAYGEFLWWYTHIERECRR